MDIEITKREVIASITIIAIMLLLGFGISAKISESQMDENEKYNKAMQITDSEVFKYGMETSVGYAFVYGDLEAIDPVSYSDIKGDYLYEKRIMEEYTRHTRTVTHKDSKGRTYTTIEEYYTWDEVSSDSRQAKKVKFLNVEFDTTQFDIPSGDYIDTIDKSSTTRYKYYGYPVKTTGTIFTNLSNNNIEQKDIFFYKDLTIEATLDRLTSGLFLIAFWIIWVGIIIAVIIGFYSLENEWLN